MQYRLVYEDHDGDCRIVVPDPKFQHIRENTDDAILRLRNAAIPDVVEFLAVKPDLIPEDLTFRESWQKGTKNEPIKIRWDKALLIHRERLKEASKRKIEALDKDHEKALERSDLPAQVGIRRTQKILETLHETWNLTHCKTVEDIKHSIPRELHDVWPYYDPIPPKSTLD